MRITIVDSSAQTLEDCANRIGDLGPAILNALQIDVRLAKEADLPRKNISNVDVLVFGPAMEARAASRAREVKKVAPLLPILVFLSQDSFKRGEFKAEHAEDIRKIFPIDAPLLEIEHELLSISDEIRKKGDTKKPLFLASRFEVIKLLGAGSMGLTYLCKHRELAGHPVVMKVLFPELAKDVVATARFRNEVFAAYGVSHPNVVKAYEYIKDGDLIAYTTEYVDGRDLSDVLAKSEQLPIKGCLRLLSEICLGLQAIHDADIVHRNIKPENILLTKDGNVKISDFGIARPGLGPKLSEHGGVVGTIAYVSPEYMLSSQIDWRSDIYAVGVLGYEMITGKSPFMGDSVYATMTKRLESDPMPPSQLRGECEPQLDNTILKALDRNPEQRYQSATEMFNDLQKLRGSDAAPLKTLTKKSSK